MSERVTHNNNQQAKKKILQQNEERLSSSSVSTKVGPGGRGLGLIMVVRREGMGRCPSAVAPPLGAPCVVLDLIHHSLTHSLTHTHLYL